MHKFLYNAATFLNNSALINWNFALNQLFIPRNLNFWRRDA